MTPAGQVQRVFYLHLPKTGGASLIRSVVDVGITWKRLGDAHEPNPSGVRKEPLGDVRFCYGHFRWKMKPYLEEEGISSAWVTVLRDPVDLLCSQHWHWQNHANVKVKHHYPRYKILSQHRSLAEYVSLIEEEAAKPPVYGEPGWPVGHSANLMTYLLEGAEPSDFQLIGETIKLLDFVPRLHALLGSEPPRQLGSVFSGFRTAGAPGSSYRPHLSPEMISRIEKLSARDMELWERWRSHAL